VAYIISCNNTIIIIIIVIVQYCQYLNTGNHCIARRVCKLAVYNGRDYYAHCSLFSVLVVFTDGRMLSFDIHILDLNICRLKIDRNNFLLDRSLNLRPRT